MLPKNDKISNWLNVEASVTGQCGDNITTKLLIKDNFINRIEQTYEGCEYTAACANAINSIAKNLSLEEALEITPKMIENEVVILPKDHLHCARLAVNSLMESISNYYVKQKNKVG